MIPDEVYKRRRRHNNTPESILLIIANFIVVSVSIPIFTTRTHINWFFWVVLGLLAIYNAFTIHRYREEYNRITVIAYVISDIVLVALFFVFRAKG